jgi:hypothetical protein
MLLNKSNKSLFVILGLLVLALNLSAWSVSDYYLGNSVPGFSARMLGMGNTGVFDTVSPLAVCLNPANLTMLERSYGLTADGLFTRNEDNRSFPLYNSFDTFIDDATYSSNINLFDDYGFGGYAKRTLNDKILLGLGLNYVPVVNFKGTYDEQVRNNRNSDDDGYPEIIAKNSFNNTGRINAMGFTLGGGFKLTEVMQMNLGATLNSLTGSSEYNKSIKWSEWAMQQSISNTTLRRNVLPDSIYTNNSDYTGTQLKIGAGLKINDRIGLGLSYTAKSELDRDSKIKSVYGPDTTMVIPAGVTNDPTQITTSKISDKYIMPSRVRFGFNYLPRNIMKTSFNAEVEYTTWTEVSNRFADSWDIHVGVEHQVTNRIPLRLGFQSLTEWQAQPVANSEEKSGQILDAIKIITPSITAGSSFSVMKNVVMDLGLSFSWREYEALDLFRDGYYNDKIYSHMSSYLLWPNGYILPTDRGWENPDKVRESFTQISAGLTWTW